MPRTKRYWKSDDSLNVLIGHEFGKVGPMLERLGYPEPADIELIMTAPPRHKDRTVNDKSRVLRVDTDSDGHCRLILG